MCWWIGLYDWWPAVLYMHILKLIVVITAFVSTPSLQSCPVINKADRSFFFVIHESFSLCLVCHDCNQQHLLCVLCWPLWYIICCTALSNVWQGRISTEQLVDSSVMLMCPVTSYIFYINHCSQNQRLVIFCCDMTGACKGRRNYNSSWCYTWKNTDSHHWLLW